MVKRDFESVEWNKFPSPSPFLNKFEIVMFPNVSYVGIEKIKHFIFLYCIGSQHILTVSTSVHSYLSNVKTNKT